MSTAEVSELPGIPETLEAVLSPEWLSAALGRRFPGIRVTSATLGPVVSRMSTNACFRIDCEGDLPEGLKPELCVKGYFSDMGTGGSSGLGEALFYRDLAEPVGVRTLHPVYAAADPDRGAGVVITEDVDVQGARFLDALSPYSPDQVADSLEQFAVLHGTTAGWGHLGGLDWLSPRIAPILGQRGIKEVRGNFEGPLGVDIPEAARDAERLVEVYPTVAAQAAILGRHSLIHGDAHVGNLFLDAAGRAHLADWQLVQRGPWYIDVGYHIASALDVEDRRRHEEELLAHYLDRVVAAGLPRPTEEEIRIGVRCGMVYGFFLWAITLMVKPPIIAELLRRLGTAVADHDAFAVVSGS